MASKRCKRDGGDDDSDSDDGGLSLPEDIILEVLVRLPAKALCRFRCVSKGWRSLTSDPAFIAAQRSRAGPLIVAMFGSAPEHELRLLDKDGNVHRVFDVRGGTAASLAPTTLLDLIFVDRAELGPMIIDPASGREFTNVGINDPSRPYVSDYSFGRAVPSGDYKVLHLSVTWSSRYGDSLRCKVATFTDGGEEPTWRRGPWAPFQTSFSCNHKATVNGILYLKACDAYSAPRRKNCIAAFDLENEEWKTETITGPLGIKEDKGHIITLTELKGTLCMVDNECHLPYLGGHYANIWFLVHPNRSIWVKKYTIEMPENLLFNKPLDVLGDGTILLLLNAFSKRNTEMYHGYILQFYNSSTKAFTDLMEMRDGFTGSMAFYTGSLVS